MNLKNFCQLFLIIITLFNQIIDIVLILVNCPHRKWGKVL